MPVAKLFFMRLGRTTQGRICARDETIETRVPARLDRLPWGRFHTLVVVALGITWVLDGLEVTLAGSIAGALEASPSLRFTASDIGLASSFYLTGAVIGALGFGWMTDRLGRRLLFFITLGLYLVSTTATAFAWNLESFCLFRMLTGAGIGGEYSAVNSTIQEMIPARYRGWTDLAINGSFWIGGALGAGGSHSFWIPPASIPTPAGGSLFSSVPRSASLFISADVDPRKPTLARHPRKGSGSGKGGRGNRNGSATWSEFSRRIDAHANAIAPAYTHAAAGSLSNAFHHFQDGTFWRLLS